MSSTEKKAAIYKDGLWTAALSQVAAAKKSDKRESTVYVVGMKGVGKSTLICKYLRPGAEARPGSDLVDYMYARKASSTAEGKHDIASIWELPGAEKLSQALARKDKEAKGAPLPAFFLPAKSVNAAVVVVVVDLSKPATILESCCEWMESINAALQEQYTLLESKGSKLPQQLKVRAQRVTFAARPDHPDKDTIRFSGIQLLICANKYDAVRERDVKEKQTVALGLRCVAHAYGAHLLFCGGNGPQAKAASTSERAEADEMARKLRAILTHAMFTGFDKKLSVDLLKKEARSRKHPETSPEGPLCIAHGCDDFKSIGLPDGRAITDPMAAVSAWRTHFRTVFKPTLAPAVTSGPDVASFAPEESIDNLVERMQKEMQGKLAQELAQVQKQRAALKAKKSVQAAAKLKTSG